MKDKLIDQHWVDIVQPSVPNGPLMLWWLIGAGLCVIAALGFYFLYFKRSRQRLRRFVRTRQKLLATTSNNKLVLHQLECRLCTYLDIVTLAQRDTLTPEWQALLESLTHSRYQKDQPSASQTATLLSTCLQLLNTNTPCHVG